MGPGPDLRAQQIAERRRREAGQREELMALVAQHGGTEASQEAYDKFLADLTVETGALPEIGRVIDAIKMAQSIEPAKVGNAVRQLFRRPRPRPAGAPPRPAAAPAPVAAAPVAPEAPAPEATATTEAPAAAEAPAATESTEASPTAE